MFRFIHTADVHLDSPLRSLALKDPDASELVANATRNSLVKTVDECLAEGVDALLIAGDLYDGELRSMKTAEFFTAEMRRLDEANIRVFIVRGNHDAQSRITRELQLPDCVHVFPGRGGSEVLEDKGVALHGVSFTKPQAPNSLLPSYPVKKAGSRNIGLLHTSLAGSPRHDTYAPCGVRDLLEMDYDYWALGHVHERSVHTQTPCTVVMPGIPQGRHINEAGAKSVTLVTVPTDGDIEFEERFTSLVHLERVTIDLDGLESWREFVSVSETTLGELADRTDAPHVIARVTLSGTTPLAGRLRRDADVVLSQLREAGRRAGSVFIEQCEPLCRIAPPKTKSTRADPVSVLRRLMTGQGLDRSRVEPGARALLGELQARLPPELRDTFDSPNGELIIRYLDRGADEILARIEVSGEE